MRSCHFRELLACIFVTWLIVTGSVQAQNLYNDKETAAGKRSLPMLTIPSSAGPIPSELPTWLSSFQTAEVDGVNVDYSPSVSPIMAEVGRNYADLMVRCLANHPNYYRGYQTLTSKDKVALRQLFRNYLALSSYENPALLPAAIQYAIRTDTYSIEAFNGYISTLPCHPLDWEDPDEFDSPKEPLYAPQILSSLTKDSPTYLFRLLHKKLGPSPFYQDYLQALREKRGASESELLILYIFHRFQFVAPQFTGKIHPSLLSPLGILTDKTTPSLAFNNMVAERINQFIPFSQLGLMNDADGIYGRLVKWTAEMYYKYPTEFQLVPLFGSAAEVFDGALSILDGRNGAGREVHRGAEGVMMAINLVATSFDLFDGMAIGKGLAPAEFVKDMRGLASSAILNPGGALQKAKYRLEEFTLEYIKNVERVKDPVLQIKRLREIQNVIGDPTLSALRYVNRSLGYTLEKSEAFVKGFAEIVDDSAADLGMWARVEPKATDYMSFRHDIANDLSRIDPDPNALRGVAITDETGALITPIINKPEIAGTYGAFLAPLYDFVRRDPRRIDKDLALETLANFNRSTISWGVRELNKCGTTTLSRSIARDIPGLGKVDLTSIIFNYRTGVQNADSSCDIVASVSKSEEIATAASRSQNGPSAWLVHRSKVETLGGNNNFLLDKKIGEYQNKLFRQALNPMLPIDTKLRLIAELVDLEFLTCRYIRGSNSIASIVLYSMLKYHGIIPGPLKKNVSLDFISFTSDSSDGLYKALSEVFVQNIDEVESLYVNKNAGWGVAFEDLPPPPTNTYLKRGIELLTQPIQSLQWQRRVPQFLNGTVINSKLVNQKMITGALKGVSRGRFTVKLHGAFHPYVISPDPANHIASTKDPNAPQDLRNLLPPLIFSIRSSSGKDVFTFDATRFKSEGQPEDESLNDIVEVPFEALIPTNLISDGVDYELIAQFLDYESPIGTFRFGSSSPTPRPTSVPLPTSTPASCPNPNPPPVPKLPMQGQISLQFVAPDPQRCAGRWYWPEVSEWVKVLNQTFSSLVKNKDGAFSSPPFPDPLPKWPNSPCGAGYPRLSGSSVSAPFAPDVDTFVVGGVTYSFGFRWNVQGTATCPFSCEHPISLYNWSQLSEPCLGIDVAQIAIWKKGPGLPGSASNPLLLYGYTKEAQGWQCSREASYSKQWTLDELWGAHGEYCPPSGASLQDSIKVKSIDLTFR